MEFHFLWKAFMLFLLATPTSRDIEPGVSLKNLTHHKMHLLTVYNSPISRVGTGLYMLPLSSFRIFAWCVFAVLGIVAVFNMGLCD